MVLVNFWRYQNPYQRFLIRIRIRIQPNDTDPTGSGSETLITIIMMILQVNSSSYLAEGGDLDQQPGTKEKPFEEEIELVWEKGGSGLNFYTDAQVSLARTFCIVNPFRKH